MNLIKKLWLVGLFLMSTLVVNYKANAAASTYGVSCSNTLWYSAWRYLSSIKPANYKSQRNG